MKAGTPTATFQAGGDITVTWQTTLVHPNSPGVRIAVHYSNQDTFNDNVLASSLDSAATGMYVL